MLAFGPLAIRLSNFEWRKRALACHDLHHLLTGYPCTPGGELQITAWEFAAGRFPNALSTLFCLPLVGAGTLVMPRRSFAAFVRGRRSRTLYATPWTTKLLDQDFKALKARLVTDDRPQARLTDVFAYAGLAGLSLALPALPILILTSLFVNRVLPHV